MAKTADTAESTRDKGKDKPADKTDSNVAAETAPSGDGAQPAAQLIGGQLGDCGEIEAVDDLLV